MRHGSRDLLDRPEIALPSNLSSTPRDPCPCCLIMKGAGRSLTLCRVATCQRDLTSAESGSALVRRTHPRRSPLLQLGACGSSTTRATRSPESLPMWHRSLLSHYSGR